MLERLHARFDSLPEPYRELVLLAVVGVLMLGTGQEYSRAVALASIGLLGVLLGSRVRYLKGE